MTERTVPDDWYPGSIPAGAAIDDEAFVETSFSFLLCRTTLEPGVRIGRGSATYLGTMFDVGPQGRVDVGNYCLLHGVRIICDDMVSIGDHALISWNVVLMDTYRFLPDRDERRVQLEQVPAEAPRVLGGSAPAAPVLIGPNTWIGFDSVVLPGVTVGAGAVVGARSVVFDDVPPYCVAAGNPATVLRRLEPSA